MNSIKNVTLRLALTSMLCAGSVGLVSNTAAAAPGWSWNLAHDMMLDFSSASVPGTNPVGYLGAWTFMESTSTSACYTKLRNSGGPGVCWGVSWSNAGCWYNAASGPQGSAIVAMTQVPSGLLTPGIPLLHPGQSSHAAVRWTNQLGQPVTVSALGRFTHIDPGGGDGVEWHVYYNSPCNGQEIAGTYTTGGGLPLMSPPNDTEAFNFSQYMNPGDELYFVVERVGDYYYDSTELDVLIVAQ